jgi:sialate O-acetylesterase
MIAERRAENENPRLPFYLVELAPFDSVRAGWAPEPTGEIAPIREALVDAAKTETDVYTVSLTPVPDVAEIHPVNKVLAAEKLANAILATLFDQPLEYTGPTFCSAEREGDILRISFTHAKGLCFSEGDTLADAFFLTKNGEKLAAEGKIEGECLLLTVPEGSVAFLLGYTNAPTHNLYNGAGYLASPFRVSL